MALSLTSELMSLSRGKSFSKAEASRTAYFPLVITEMLVVHVCSVQLILLITLYYGVWAWTLELICLYVSLVPML